MENVVLIHASARPLIWKDALNRYAAKMSGDNMIHHVLIYDKRHEIDFAESGLTGSISVVNEGRQDFVTAVNAGVRFALETWKNGLLVVLADDSDAPKDWDRLLLEKIPDLNKPCVLHVNSGTPNNDDGKLITQSICTLAYARLDEHFFYPDYFSIYSDNDWSVKAYLREMVVRCPDLMFKHLHHSLGLFTYDVVSYEHDNEARYKIGKEIFERRTAEGFK